MVGAFFINMEAIMKYTLEIKQIVSFPRVRIYRELIQHLMDESSLSARGTSNLFLFMILCSYANFRSCKKRFDGKRYLLGPGEWACSLKELAEWFRLSRQSEVLEVLDELKKKRLLTYYFLPGKKVIRYKIRNWNKFNTVLEYECRSYKDCGFLFFPIAFADKLLAGKNCSELDALMDLWLNTIYKDERVMGSDLGPVVYYRNGAGDPKTSCSKLGKRWGRSRATANRMIAKMEELGYITNITFSGSLGSVLYLNNYLSTMFDISDTVVDKAEVSLSIGLVAQVNPIDLVGLEAPISTVSKDKFPVSKILVDLLASEVLQMLSAQGFTCCACSKKTCILSNLSVACGRFAIDISCDANVNCKSSRRHRFEVRIVNSSG